MLIGGDWICGFAQSVGKEVRQAILFVVIAALNPMDIDLNALTTTMMIYYKK